METIDVLLPYYGDVGFLKAAAQSVLDQDYPDWRLVVLDDAYPDDEPARWFAALADPRVTYIQNPANLGASGNYRKALALAEAPIVVMMGADDLMLPSYLSAVATALTAHPDTSVVQPGVVVIDEYGARSRTITDMVKRLASPRPRPELTIGGEDMAASLLHAGWHYFPSLAWRTEEMQRFGFRPGYDVVQDLALLLDIAAAGGSMLLISDPVFQYRRHSSSDSSVRAVDGRRFAEERRFFREEAARFRELGWKKAALAADLHWTSRLHALLVLLRSVRRPTVQGTVVLGRHVLT
ncbi:glycosyltransferase [Arthrobacter sp. zg-Y20]|uniref:glycosyltransferase family 2 protein n=1 Tax=unclassified Arthrobacter TaxID=235627 RepID=UPI001D1571E6|nr:MULTISPECIES: glycosyltransferase family 2 protein [unclassified Arthrobacter]MCC3276857.1 glycosyltransferase [Arthrobacter sp. zg-Y20]MDK1317018.1 glycosyltransferase family 2 protein [Arthrobacter sp. zg.Y20]WIB05269.1 glycosyltransferase family 2 protein [Arthrobacter sp. zg-Y20]